MAAPFVMLVGVLCAATLYFQFAGPTLLDFGLESPAGMTALAASWAKGGRRPGPARRALRPFHRALPGYPDGITADGKDLAVALGAAFARLGIERADFLTSPLTRTRQTSTYMFGATVPEQAWLANCKTVQVDDIARTKVAGVISSWSRTAIASEKIEKDLGLAATEPPYGVCCSCFRRTAALARRRRHARCRTLHRRHRRAK